jgi:hypothetical protein
MRPQAMGFVQIHCIIALRAAVMGGTGSDAIHLQ